MSNWWDGIPATEVTVLCGGDDHTVRWNAGELIAVDHSDPEGEVKLAAPAGDSVPCLELLRTWSRQAEDPHVLTLASRGPTDPPRRRHRRPQVRSGGAAPGDREADPAAARGRWSTAGQTAGHHRRDLDQALANRTRPAWDRPASA